MGESYASGNWLVKEGSETEFLSRWTEFLKWTRAENPGFQSASLLGDVSNPRHFVSFARWDTDEARGAWKSRPEFMQRMGGCRALCDDFSGSDYGVAVNID